MRSRLPRHFAVLTAFATTAAVGLGASTAPSAQGIAGPVTGPTVPIVLRLAPQARSLDGTAHLADSARSVAHDSAGNVIAAGYLTNAATGRDFVVTKHTPGGRLLWSRSFNIPGHDEAGAVAVDSRDHIWAVGYAPTGGNNGNTMAWVMEYSPEGFWLSSSSLAGTVPGPSRALDVAIDPGDNVVVCGQLANAVPAGSASTLNLDAFVWRIPVSGGPGTYQTLTGRGVGGADVARAVAVDAAGNIAIAGFQTNQGGSKDHLLAYYDSGLHLQWRVIEGDGNAHQDDEWLDVAMDSRGDIGVAGRCFDLPGDSAFSYGFYRADNLGMTRLELDRPDPVWEEARSVTFDASDRMIVTGSAADANGRQALVTLRQPWRTGGFGRHTFQPTVASGWGVGNSVKTDRDGNIYVAGAERGSAGSSNFVLLKLAASNLALLSRFERNGADPNSVDEARSVSVDAGGWPAAAGELQNTATGTDYTVAF